MSTYTNAAELAGKELKFEDVVTFTIHSKIYKYEVLYSFLHLHAPRNSTVFGVLDLDADSFASAAYGYAVETRSWWPRAKDYDYAALTRLVLALYAEIERQTGEVAPIPEVTPEATPEPQKTDLQRFIEFFAQFGIETRGVKGDPDPGWLLSIENGTSENVDCTPNAAVNIWFDENGKFEIFNIR